MAIVSPRIGKRLLTQTTVLDSDCAGLVSCGLTTPLPSEVELAPLPVSNLVENFGRPVRLLRALVAPLSDRAKATPPKPPPTNRGPVWPQPAPRGLGIGLSRRLEIVL